MKRVLQITLGAALLTLTSQSCDKLKSVVKIPNVTFSGASTDIVIPPASDTANVQAAGIYYNIDSMIKAQSSDAAQFSNIGSVKVKSVTLTLSDADAQNNFANFQYVLASFNTDANGGNYPAYALAVIQDNPDAYAATLTLTPSDPTQNIKQYFQPQTNFYYLFVGKLRRSTTHTLHCHVDVTYDIGF